MVPFIQDFFASCPSRMGKARRSKLCNPRQVVGKLPSWRQETDWKNPKSQGFCLLLPVSPSLKSLYKENPCIKYIQSPLLVDISGFHPSASSTDTPISFMARQTWIWVIKKNHKCKKLTGEMVFPFLCPTAFKERLGAIVHLSQTIPVAVDHLPGKGFQGSQIYLLHTFHSALK